MYVLLLLVSMVEETFQLLKLLKNNVKILNTDLIMTEL